jgi:hypothetical protein
VSPGLAHWTVWCATGQCPVHEGTRRQTLHLQEFSEELRYNSPDCPVPQGRATLNSPASRIRSAIIHRTVRCDSGATATSRNGRLQRIKCASARAEEQCTRGWHTGQPTGPVRCTTEQPGGPTSQSSNGQNPTTLVTWLAHRTCPVHHTTVNLHQRSSLVVGAINTPTTPHSLASKFSTLLHLTRASIQYKTHQRDQILSQLHTKL